MFLFLFNIYAHPWLSSGLPLFLLRSLVSCSLAALLCAVLPSPVLSSTSLLASWPPTNEHLASRAAAPHPLHTLSRPT